MKEFVAEVRKRKKYTLWVEIPKEIVESENLKEGQFVKVALEIVKKEAKNKERA